MIFMKIKILSLAMHHGKLKKKSTEFQSIMEVSKLPWLQKKDIKNEKNIFHRKCKKYVWLINTANS